MAHQTIRSTYERLAERLNKFPQGVHPSELPYPILATLFSVREAELISVLPIKPFSARRAASIWDMEVHEAQRILNELADRAILVDYLEADGEWRYVLPPPMAGFFEFSLMRIRDDINQKLLSELFYEYMNVEEDFIRNLFTEGETQLGRVFVQEPSLPSNNGLHVLDYERASGIIKNSEHIGIGICYCRHKMEHIGKACDAPRYICMTFGTCADSLIRHGAARRTTESECHNLLDRAYENNLVQFGENVQNDPSFICNCCGCCCEAMIAARKFGMLEPVHTSNYLPEITPENCNGCGKCVAVCLVESLALVSAHDPHRPKRKQAQIDVNTCLGCGVCIRACKNDALKLVKRPKRVLTPVNTTHRSVIMAIERGKLQNLILDNQIALSHRALAALMGVILKLPPVKQAMASEQMKSRYLVALLERMQQ